MFDFLYILLVLYLVHQFSKNVCKIVGSRDDVLPCYMSENYVLSIYEKIKGTEDSHRWRSRQTSKRTIRGFRTFSYKCIYRCPINGKTFTNYIGFY